MSKKGSQGRLELTLILPEFAAVSQHTIQYSFCQQEALEGNGRVHSECRCGAAKSGSASNGRPAALNDMLWEVLAR